MPVRIVTDSACDLRPRLCEELGIEVVPLTIRFGDREYVDRKELSADDVLARARVVVGAARDRGTVGRRVRGDVPAPARRRRRRHRLHQPLGAPVGDDAVGAGRRQGARRPVPDRDHRLRERVDGHRQPRAARGAARRATAPTSTTIVREVEDRRDRAARCSRRSTRSSTCARAGASAARRRCSARCCRSSRSSPSSTARSSRPARCAPARRRCASCSTRSPTARSSRSACCTRARPTSTSSSRCSSPKVPDAEIVVGTIGPVVGVHIGPRRHRHRLDRARRS